MIKKLRRKWVAGVMASLAVILLVLLGAINGIRRVISVLLDNAVKYAAEGSGIDLCLSGRGRQAVLEVRNVCRPFPKDPEKLFDRFYREDESRSRRTGGYGIGLSVARAAVQARRGKLTARREEGDVLCFQAVFPVLPANSQKSHKTGRKL